MRKRRHSVQFTPARERGEDTKDGDEAAEEHDLAAVTLEQVLAELDARP
jgi:hypothetical protein